MKGSKVKKNTPESNCFTSILKTFTCGGHLPPPTQSDHLLLPKFKSNGHIYPTPNELQSNESLEAEFGKKDDGDDHPRQEQPGLVARLMGLESVPRPQDSVLNLRSKSLNSLHLFIFPDTFLDHVSSSPHQSRSSCHRRAHSTFPVMGVEPSPSREKPEPWSGNVGRGEVSKPDKRRKKVEDENQRKGSKKNGIKKVDGDKCRLSEDQRTRKCVDPRDDRMKGMKGNKLSAKLRKERVFKVKNVDELKAKQVQKGRHRNHVSKDESMVRPRRRRSSRNIAMDRRTESHERNSRCFQGKLCYRTRKDMENSEELKARVIRLADEECVRDDEWVSFEENVKKVGENLAGEMLQLLISQFLDELLR